MLQADDHIVCFCSFHPPPFCKPLSVPFQLLLSYTGAVQQNERASEQITACETLKPIGLLSLQCLDTLCGRLSEDIGITLASSEQLCTEASELDLASI